MGVLDAFDSKKRNDPARNAGLVIFMADTAGRQQVEQALQQLDISDAYIDVGGIDDIIAHLGKVDTPPQRMIIDISGLAKPLDALDRLADACDPSVQVYTVGDRNDVTLYRLLLQAGIADYRYKPITTDALRLWLDEKDDFSVRQSRSGKVIAVAGTRGGVGVTTIAAHLARELTAGGGLRRVVYLDMDYYGGAGTTLLGLPSNHAMSEALNNIEALDPQFLERVLTTKDHRLFVLAFNHSYEDEFHAAPGAIARLMELLSQHFHYLVVDLPDAGGMVANEVFSVASMACIVSDHSIHSGRVITQLDAHLKGHMQAPVLHLVLNSTRFPASSHVSTQEFSKAVDHPVSLDIPYDGKFPSLAENLGEPLAKDSAMRQSVARLARLLTGEAVGNANHGSWFSRLLRKRS